MKNYFILIFTALICSSVQAQQKLTLKTTESYSIKLPASYGDFQHKDEFMTWQLDFNNKKMTYDNGIVKKTFNFSKIEANPNSTEERNIYNFENNNEALTLIVGNGNYLKIKVYTEKVANSNPASFNSIKVYTNYSVENYTDLLAD